MKTIIIFLSILTLSRNMFAQIGDSLTFAVDNYASNLEENKQIICSSKLAYDSIDVNVSSYGNLFISVNHFSTSKSLLNIEYILQNSNLVLIKVGEQSPVFPDLHFYYYFYLSHNSIYKTRMFGERDIGIAEIPGANTYGYNETFTEAFIKKFVLKQWKRIKRS